MGAASLALLKGSKNTNVSDELETQKTETAAAAPAKKATVTVAKKKAEEPVVDAAAPEVAAAETAPETTEAEEVTITAEDIAKMSAKAIDDLLDANEVPRPDGWADMGVKDKRTWLIAQMSDQTEEVADAAPEGEGEAAAQVAEEAAEAVGAEKKEEPAQTKAVSKAAAKVAAAKDDQLANTVAEIENLKEKQARALVGELANASEEMHFKLGGVLSVIQANSWFKPHASFREYVENEHGIAYRRAAYWVQIYNDLVESGVSFNVIKHLGWTKLTVLSPILTKDNVEEWVKVAEQQTVLQLTETVKNHKAKNAKDQLSDGDEKAKTVTTKTFKVHDDQRATIEAAIEKAKAAADTQVDTVALEFICLDYLGGTSTSLDQRLASVGMDAALEALQKAFPNIADLKIELSAEE